MEKLETVKRLVRENNYKNNDITYKQCQELGVTVNRVGLEIFARKLRTMDRAEEVNSHKLHSMAEETRQATSRRTLTFERSSVELGSFNSVSPYASHSSNITHLNQVENRRQSGTFDPAERKREITFELGTIKVREQQLLIELNSLDDVDSAAEA